MTQLGRSTIMPEDPDSPAGSEGKAAVKRSTQGAKTRLRSERVQGESAQSSLANLSQDPAGEPLAGTKGKPEK
jgi:hypothetical protein